MAIFVGRFFAYVIRHLDSDVGNLALNFPSIFASPCGNEKRNPLMRFPFFGVDDAVSKDVVVALAVQAELIVVPVCRITRAMYLP